MAQKNWKWLNMAESSWNSWKRQEMDGNGWKSFALNGRNLLEKAVMTEMAGNVWKIIVFGNF